MASKIWARCANGIVAEIITLDAALTPGKDIYTPAVAATLVDVTSVGGVACGWVNNGGSFSAPPAPSAAQSQAALAASLIAYANAKQVALRDGGINVNVGTASTPDEVNVASDVNGRSLVTGCVQLVGLATQNSQPAPTFNWINNGGTQLTLTAAQMMTLAAALGNFVQATYTALGAVLAAISAGTITTTAAIDAAAWPATSY